MFFFFPLSTPVHTHLIPYEKMLFFFVGLRTLRFTSHTHNMLPRKHTLFSCFITVTHTHTTLDTLPFLHWRRVLPVVPGEEETVDRSVCEKERIECIVLAQTIRSGKSYLCAPVPPSPSTSASSFPSSSSSSSLLIICRREAGQTRHELNDREIRVPRS